MKRIMLIVVLLITYFFIIRYKLSTVFIEKIDLELKEDEIAFIFLSSDSYKTVLLKDNDITTLLVLDINSSKNLKNDIAKFTDKKIDYVFIDKNFDLNIDYFIKDSLKEYINMNKYNIIKKENIIQISNRKYNLCIYNIGNNNDISDCNFIYFLDMDYQINLSENLKAIFYEKTIKNKFKENTYIKWIDNYEMSSDTYNILKISNDAYDIITIPIQN